MKSNSQPAKGNGDDFVVQSQQAQLGKVEANIIEHVADIGQLGFIVRTGQEWTRGGIRSVESDPLIKPTFSRYTTSSSPPAKVP
jgi:hypothetical protein